MPSVPRILRATPGPEHTLLAEPWPVIALIHWQSLRTCQAAHAWALAHSDHHISGRAILIAWAEPRDDTLQHDWIRRSDILQPGDPIAPTRRMEWEDPPRLHPVTLPAPPRPESLLASDPALR